MLLQKLLHMVMMRMRLVYSLYLMWFFFFFFEITTKEVEPGIFQSLDVKAQKALECPCIADLRSGPCGEQFSEAFLCFLKITSEEKVITMKFLILVWKPESTLVSRIIILILSIYPISNGIQACSVTWIDKRMKWEPILYCCSMRLAMAHTIFWRSLILSISRPSFWPALFGNILLMVLFIDRQERERENELWSVFYHFGTILTWYILLFWLPLIHEI